MQTTLKLSTTLKSNKELTYRVLAQIASSVPSKLRFDQVDYNGGRLITIQGIAASDQDILKFIENLGNQNLMCVKKGRGYKILKKMSTSIMDDP